jgi:hypothetical protein
LNGASKAAAVRVADTGTVEDYAAGFDALSNQEDVQIVVCDSADAEVHQALRTAVEQASQARRERIAVVGGGAETVSALTGHALQINSERVVLVCPRGLGNGETVSGCLSAAALAGAMAGGNDPAAPLNGASLYGLNGLEVSFGDNDIDALVRGGVTPLESVGGVVSPVRCVTTKTLTGDAIDTTWREASTIRIVDDVIPSIRAALRSKFARTKNTAQTRGAIRSQVILELEKKLSAQIIDGYGDVVVRVGEDPATCMVEFSFAVAHGLNQVYLTAHVTV